MKGTYWEPVLLSGGRLLFWASTQDLFFFSFRLCLEGGSVKINDHAMGATLDCLFGDRFTFLIAGVIGANPLLRHIVLLHLIP